MSFVLFLPKNCLDFWYHHNALTAAINMFGSDTDTIGVFLGALIGAYYGTQAINPELLANVQDREYLLKTARRLHAIASQKPQLDLVEDEVTKRETAYFRILAWEIDLHNMFQEVEENHQAFIVHPTLGYGFILDKEIKPIKREGYVAKLIHVKFDCGQSCVFHSRVENNEKVSESLAADIVHALS